MLIKNNIRYIFQCVCFVVFSWYGLFYFVERRCKNGNTFNVTLDNIKNFAKWLKRLKTYNFKRFLVILQVFSKFNTFDNALVLRNHKKSYKGRIFFKI